MLILCSGFLDLVGDVAREPRRGQDAREPAEAEDPTDEGAIEAHVERHHDAAARRLAQTLRSMPLASLHIVGDCRLELDFHALGRSRMHAEGMRERFVRQILDRREALLER